MIKAIILDVDGTLTDGKIYISNEGIESKRFDIKDGMGIKRMLGNGIIFAIITGRKSKIVDIRASELSINYVYQGFDNKIDALIRFSKETGVSFDEMLYIGDDINDLAVMDMVRYSACPNDAVDVVKNKVCYISTKDGGNGAVRDILDIYVEKVNEK